MVRKKPNEEPEKPHRLSLAELAAHDDACSDAMVDNAYFKSYIQRDGIRKNRTRYNPLRIKDEEVPRILLHKVIVDKDLAAAEKALLALPGIKRYRNGLRSKVVQENFLKHLHKYISMYMTDCPWEVSTTNRYTITTFEAAVTARQRVKQGQLVKYLTGTLVPLTLEESADLDLTNRNFSIVISSRKKNSSIFLGPARFANHDCDANGRLVTKGADGMEVIAVKNIEVGDEVTVSYGDDYFGPGNVDCLCHTCERLVRNGWAAGKSAMDSVRSSIGPSREQQLSPVPSTKRKRDLQEPTVSHRAKLQKLKQSPSKLQQSWTPPTSSDEDRIEPGLSHAPTLLAAVPLDLADGSTLSPPTSPSCTDPQASRRLEVLADEETIVVASETIHGGRRSTSPVSAPKPSTATTMTAHLLGHVPLEADQPPPPSPISLAPPQTEHEGEHARVATIKIESVETEKVERNQVLDPSVSETSEPAGYQVQMAVTKYVQTEAPAGIPATEPSGKAPQDDNISPDSPAILPSIEPPAVMIGSTVNAQLSVRPVHTDVRIPGDYLLTRKLLSQPHDRWVQCMNESALCSTYFLQPNGYQTRRECPRCERHSMLYGFSWPKTDPDPRVILEQSKTSGGGGPGRKKKSTITRSAFKRSGKCGKGSWVEGGGDTEQRVMDHRTVHRFVLPGDEKAVTRKGLLKMAELARSRGDEIEITERRSRRDSGSAGFDSDGRGSETPDEFGRRRSNRFMTRVGVYADS